MFKDAIAFSLIVAAVIAVWTVTPANAQYYQDYSGYQDNGAEAAAQAATDAANAAAESNAQSQEIAQRNACRANAMMFNRNPAYCY